MQISEHIFSAVLCGVCCMGESSLDIDSIKSLNELQTYAEIETCFRGGRPVSTGLSLII